MNKTGGCWEWTASVSEKGYGYFRVGKKTFSAHRWIYEFLYGPIPYGKLVCHTCDNPPCVNPDHLWLGTAQDNSSDMVSKDRQTWGLRNSQAKLTAGEVDKIRSLRGKLTTRQIGAMFDVSCSTVSLIHNNKSRKLG